VVESKEGCIIGWGLANYPLNTICPCVYNCANENLHGFNPLDITPRLIVVSDYIELIKDHLFLLHKEAPPGSANMVHDGESNSRKYFISEFHLHGKATT